MASAKRQIDNVIEKVPDGSTILFSNGVYHIDGLHVTNKSLTFAGSGDKTILVSDHIGNHAIQFSGKGKSLTLKNLQLVYTGGWADASGITDGVLVTPDALQGKESMDSVFLDHVTFRDFYNAVYVLAPLRSLKVTNCNFLYTYGRAGVSNAPPYQHPAVAVLGSGTETIVSNCYFDGLMDSSFRGLKGNPPKSQRTPMDGLYKTGGGNPKFTSIDHNILKNHGIEGIICERMNSAGSYTTRIKENKIIGPSFKEHSFYGDYCPAIVVANVQGAEITKNIVIGSPLGLDLIFTNSVESNACMISNNTFSSVLCGARIKDGGSNTVFCDNQVFCSSEPARSFATADIGWCALVGVAASGDPIIRSNAFQSDQPFWDARTTLLSRAQNEFTVSSTNGIQPNRGVLISLSHKGLGYFPVGQISNHKVTVAPEWAAAYPHATSGLLVYAQRLGNFTSLGAVCSFGKSSRVLVEGNRIEGFLQDVATSNGGVVITKGNQVENVVSSPPASPFIQRGE